MKVIILTWLKGDLQQNFCFSSSWKGKYLSYWNNLGKSWPLDSLCWVVLFTYGASRWNSNQVIGTAHAAYSPPRHNPVRLEGTQMVCPLPSYSHFLSCLGSGKEEEYLRPANSVNKEARPACVELWVGTVGHEGECGGPRIWIWVCRHFV